MFFNVFFNLVSVWMFYGCGYLKVIVNKRLEFWDCYSFGNKFFLG